MSWPVTNATAAIKAASLEWRGRMKYLPGLTSLAFYVFNSDNRTGNRGHDHAHMHDDYCNYEWENDHLCECACDRKLTFVELCVAGDPPRCTPNNSVHHVRVFQVPKCAIEYHNKHIAIPEATPLWDFVIEGMDLLFVKPLRMFANSRVNEFIPYNQFRGKCAREKYIARFFELVKTVTTSIPLPTQECAHIGRRRKRK